MLAISNDITQEEVNTLLSGMGRKFFQIGSQVRKQFLRGELRNVFPIDPLKIFEAAKLSIKWYSPKEGEDPVYGVYVESSTDTVEFLFPKMEGPLTPELRMVLAHMLGRHFCKFPYPYRLESLSIMEKNEATVTTEDFYYTRESIYEVACNYFAVGLLISEDLIFQHQLDGEEITPLIISDRFGVPSITPSKYLAVLLS